MSANSSRSAAACRMTLMSNAPRFALGQLVATPGAMELLETPQDKRSSLPTLWIITESDRSVTTLLLPSEY